LPPNEEKDPVILKREKIAKFLKDVFITVLNSLLVLEDFRQAEF
jgi:hypothetical protein